ncbi:MAG: hypothetical protein ACE5FA_01425, partial [Dehalococcoidia bacterium]
MSVFPKKAIREISSQAALNPFEGDTEGTRATGFLDVVPAVFNSFMTEDLSVSEIRNRAPIVKGQFRIMRELTGNKRWDINNFDFPGQDQAFQQIVDSEDEIRGFQEIAPGRGLLRADEIREQIRLLAADARRRRDDVLSRAGDKARFFGQLVGVGAAAMTDPINVASLPFAAASGAGLVRVALTAAGINVATEAAIQATAVYDYKKELRAPYSIGEAVFNTFAAGVAGGVLEGGVRGIGRAITAISEKTLARTASKAVDSGKVKPNARTRAAIEVLEENDELHRTNPFPEQGPAGQAAHVEAMAE